MTEITPEQAAAWLKQPIIVVVPSKNVYAVSFIFGAETLDEALDPSGPRLEVRGPLGGKRQLYVWLTSLSDGRVMPDVGREPPAHLTEEAQEAANAWYAWEDTRSSGPFQ